MICIETQDISENSVVVQAANKGYYFTATSISP